jgi:hypothetical protein
MREGQSLLSTVLSQRALGAVLPLDLIGSLWISIICTISCREETREV